ncbi:hypothetical protein LNP07_06795, partial [Apilactobacillus sp. M161]
QQQTNSDNTNTQQQTNSDNTNTQQQTNSEKNKQIIPLVGSPASKEVTVDKHSKEITESDDPSKEIEKDYNNCPYIYDDSQVHFIKNGKEININDPENTVNGTYNKKSFNFGIKITKKDLGDNTYFYVTNCLKVPSANGLENYDLKWTFEKADGIDELNDDDPIASLGFHSIGSSTGAPFLQIKDWLDEKRINDDAKGQTFIHTNMQFYKHANDLNKDKNSEEFIKNYVDKKENIEKPNLYLQYWINGDQKFEVPENQIKKASVTKNIDLNYEDNNAVFSSNDMKWARFMLELNYNDEDRVDFNISVSKDDYRYDGQAITAYYLKENVKTNYYKDGTKNKIKNSKVNSDVYESRYNDNTYSENYTDANKDVWTIKTINYQQDSKNVNDIWTLENDNLWHKNNSNDTKKNLSEINNSYKYGYGRNTINCYYVRTKENVSKNFSRIVQYSDMQGNTIKDSLNQKNAIKYFKIFNINGEFIEYQNEKGETIAGEPEYNFPNFNIESSQIEGYTLSQVYETKDDNDTTLINLYYNKDKQEESKDKQEESKDKQEES